jgi:multisubunit Na+/H+ antiporter MnhC subunit
MTDLELMKILWAASTITCSISVIGLISIYRKISIGLSIISIALHHIVVNKGVVEYGTGIPSMAEDTKVAE